MLAVLINFLLPLCEAMLPAPEIIRWIRPQDGYYNEFVYNVQPSKDLIFYGGWRNPSLVVLTYPRPVQLKLNCRIDRLPRMFPLLKMSLCTDDSECADLHELQKKSFVDIEWTVNYDNFTGAIFKAELSLETNTTTRNLFCVADNGISKIETNRIYIEDLRRRFVFNVTEIDLPNQVFENSPFRCNCTKVTGIATLYRYPYYQWLIVDGAGVSKDVMDIGKSHRWPVQILSAGTLYWPYIPEKLTEMLQGKRLLCKVEGVLAAKTSNVLNISVKDSKLTPKLIIKPQLIDVFMIPNRVKPPLIRCNFKIGPGSYNISWIFNGVKLTEGSDDSKFFVSGSELQLFGPFDTNEAFNLRCSVSWKPSSGAPIETKEKTVAVTASMIKQLPQFRTNLPFYVYTINHGNVSVVCSKPKSSMYTMELKINGESISLAKKSDVEDVFENLRNLTNKPMYGMVAPLPINTASSITYTATNVVVANGSQLSSAHSLQCILKNSAENLFTVYQYVIISAIHEPVISRTPSNCSNCNFCGPQVFTCSVGNKERVMYEGIHANFQWGLWDGPEKWKNVTDYSDVFDVSRIGKSESRLAVSTAKKQLRKVGFNISDKGAVFSDHLLFCKIELRNTFTSHLIYESETPFNSSLATLLQGVYYCYIPTAIWIIIIAVVIFYIIILILGIIIIFAYRNILPNSRVVLALRSRLLNRKLMVIFTSGTEVHRPPITWEVVLMMIIGLLLVPVIIGIYIIILVFTGRGVIPIKSL